MLSAPRLQTTFLGPPALKAAAAERLLVQELQRSGGSLPATALQPLYKQVPWLSEAVGGLAAFCASHSDVLQYHRPLGAKPYVSIPPSGPDVRATHSNARVNLAQQVRRGRTAPFWYRPRHVAKRRTARSSACEEHDKQGDGAHQARVQHIAAREPASKTPACPEQAEAGDVLPGGGHTDRVEMQAAPANAWARCWHTLCVSGPVERGSLSQGGNTCYKQP